MPSLNTNYRVIRTEDELRKAVELLSTHQVVGLDTETTELDPYYGRLRLIQLAAPSGVYIIDVDAFRNGDLRKTEALQSLRDLLSAPRPIKILHNAKFDAKFIKHTLGADLGGIFDTLLASQLLGAGDIEERHGLDAVASRYLSEAVDKSERLSNWDLELTEAQLEYAARDAAVLLPLREKLIERLRSDSLIKAATLEFDCVMTVADMELAGFYMHKERWLEQLAIVEKRRGELAEELQSVLAEESSQGTLFGGPQRDDINLDSHQQLTQALERLGIPVPDSTRNWKLQPLALEYPVIATLLEYRTVQKALTSYGQNMIELINPTTHRLHADFRQIGAPTGRFSCTNPNIQQVPHAVEYRRCFSGHPEGRKLIIADYSQIELRILAEFSGDRAFIDAFRSGADLHRVTAAEVFNVAVDQVSREQRDFAKRLNFGVVYGIGAQRFSIMTGVGVPEAEGILKKYFSTYRQLDTYLNEAANRAVRERQARTGSGRLVRFRYDEQDRQQISMTKRNGKNTPIQGTSADILKRALRLLRDELRGTNGQIVNIIHDEIVVEADAGEAEDVAVRVERAMCAAGEEYVKTVPVKVETEIADEWVK
ncbi:MAG TPA: DNA polymerase [Pyrinomonadaceae bacterium]|jgi:DNA polymerase I-like protein with 3'-5' exonuclease and polymerase domains|nr:DNA polymerase [Pyrinomonadaceae bacterium]